MVDRIGIPLAIRCTAANVNDNMMLQTMLESIEPIKVKGGRGRPRKRPDKLHADKGYDCRRCREYLRRKGIKARIARKAKWGQAKAVKAQMAAKGIKERLGRYRWVVERTLAWLNRFRRLAIRYERRDDIHQAFLDLGCALICWNFLN